MFGRQKIAALVAEFVGTAVLVTAVLATIYGRTGFPLFIALAAGLAVGLMVLVVGPVSGAHINPIVTVGLWTIRRIQTTQAIVYVAAQMLGGVAAWQLAEFLLNRPLESSAGSDLDWRILIAEAVGAFVFTTAIAAAVARAYTGGKLAVTAGLGFMFGMLISSIASNGLINPAVAVGIHAWNWAYILGPLAGAVIGMNLYGLVFEPIDNPRAVTAKAAVTTVAKKAKAKAKTTTKKRSVSRRKK